MLKTVFLSKVPDSGTMITVTLIGTGTFAKYQENGAVAKTWVHLLILILVFKIISDMNSAISCGDEITTEKQCDLQFCCWNENAATPCFRPKDWNGSAQPLFLGLVLISFLCLM